MVVLAVLLLGAACSNAGRPSSGAEGTGQQATVRSLTSIDELQQQFNRDEGVTRLILLVSPT
jgi:hypothetical protein